MIHAIAQRITSKTVTLYQVGGKLVGMGCTECGAMFDLKGTE